MSAWIGVDLDGTLAYHYWPQDGEYDPRRIGAPVEPMVARVREWLSEGLRVKIFTARVTAHGSWPSHDPEIHPSIEEMVRIVGDWTERHIGERLEVTNVKDYEMIALWDDRAVRVMLNTGLACCDG